MQRYNKACLSNEVLARMAKRMDRSIAALTGPDETVQTFNKRLHARHLADAQSKRQCAETLLEGCNETDRLTLENIRAEALAFEFCANDWYQRRDDNLPKMNRLMFQAEIIVTWKLLQGVDAMPRRTRDTKQIATDTALFQSFLDKLCRSNKASKSLNRDNLHKDILKVETRLSAACGTFKSRTSK